MNRRTHKNKHRGGNGINIPIHNENVLSNAVASNNKLRNNVIFTSGFLIVAIGGITAFFAYANK
jgi:hypothetical protein